MNANPNKRQRQPALLGDHPPEYGKACGVHAFTHLPHLLTNRGVDVKTTTNRGCIYHSGSKMVLLTFNLSEGCVKCFLLLTCLQPPPHVVCLSFVDSQVVITDTRKRATVDPMKADGWGRPWVVRGAAEPVSVTADNTVPRLRLQANMAPMQTHQ